MYHGMHRGLVTSCKKAPGAEPGVRDGTETVSDVTFHLYLRGTRVAFRDRCPNSFRPSLSHTLSQSLNIPVVARMF